ncbi:hypothetical protein NW762_000234 [Fusarium torreyae]|uniref:Uncharacterized protein n=1 Tax=Fusarium torreyae TaxID=1237075 RepID=A0A9W8SIW3_9HYPO|nr:hypothetical protein NW762_000234 [Fusarium torreyae]
MSNYWGEEFPGTDASKVNPDPKGEDKGSNASSKTKKTGSATRKKTPKKSTPKTPKTVSPSADKDSDEEAEESGDSDAEHENDTANQKRKKKPVTIPDSDIEPEGD